VALGTSRRRPPRWRTPSAATAVGASAGLLARTYSPGLTSTLAVTQAFLPLVRRADAGRIVNVSSTMGSLTVATAAGRPLAALGELFACTTSKTMLNSLTAWLSVELTDTPIMVNSVCPGYHTTDMNGGKGAQHPREGAKVIVRAATLAPGGPTGTWIDEGGTVAW
jgi:NAD(P)-dependent dehydrogenase (short-subunit alcohol dehydrogenase family)